MRRFTLFSFLNTLLNYFIYKCLPSICLNPGTCIIVHSNYLHIEWLQTTLTQHMHTTVITELLASFTRTLKIWPLKIVDLPSACGCVNFCMYTAKFSSLSSCRFFFWVLLGLKIVTSVHFMCVLWSESMFII